MEREIIYEPHPVAPERKAELRARGYKIIDAQFAPGEWEVPDLQDEEPGDAGEPLEPEDEKAPDGEPEKVKDKPKKDRKAKG